MPIQPLQSSTKTTLLVNNTALTYLILNSNIKFTQNHIYKILGLCSENAFHIEIFKLLIQLINSAANSIFCSIRAHSLSQYPLTNIQYISYMIADEFPEIFYVSIAKKVEFEINNGVSVLVDKWSTETVTLTVNRSKYNEMWIITYLLKTEFEKIIQQKKRSLNKQQEPK